MGARTAPRWLRKQRQAREELARWPQRIVLGAPTEPFPDEAFKAAVRHSQSFIR